LALITIAFALLFSSRLRVGVLAIQVVPDADWTRYLGLVLTVAGVLFAIWGRASLGRNWSGVVSIKQEHHLVQHGPYAIVRHPIYSGFLLAMLGTALADGQTGCLIAVALAFLAWWLKSRTEEEFLAAQFGDAYTNYQARVRALVPFVF
jgi:protein-S-isoprenylcysteine O-methyltransferase Ste14